MDLSRLPHRHPEQRIPTPVAGEPGLFLVDATWGKLAPMTLAPGVRTVGELEVIAHIEAGEPLVDTRRPVYVQHGTLPGALNVPHAETLEHRDAFAPDRPTVVFCNGPQCTATPQAVQMLLEAGHPPEALLYYRGGIHDWVTLGLPVVPA